MLGHSLVNQVLFVYPQLKVDAQPFTGRLDRSLVAPLLHGLLAKHPDSADLDAVGGQAL